MTSLPSVELPIPPGMLTEPTARGTKGRYKDCDKIRFRQGLPEKLGGWILASIGSDDGDVDTNDANSDFNGASVNYAGAATVITMDSNITVLDNDPVLLYGDSTTGGLGARSIASGGADGSYIPVTDAGVTAAVGDVVIFEMAEEFTGSPATIISGGLAGDVQITLDTSVNTFLKAGTIITIALQAGGRHHTTFSANLSGGAVVVSFEIPLPSDATLATSVQIWAAGSEYLDFTTDLSYIFRNLANAPAATTQLILTEALPEAVGTADIDIRPFQQTFADGDQAASATLTIDPDTDFAITSNTPFPNGFIVLPTFLQDQVCYEGFARGLHDWSDLSDQQWLAIGTDTKLYVVNGGTLFDITPVRDSGTLIGPYDTISLSTVVTVNDSAHGVIVGDSVRFTDGDAVAGLDLNDEFIVQTVPDANTYTITALFPANALVSGGGGTVSFEYDITIGFDSGSEVIGWGTGRYGANVYGIGTAGTGIIRSLRIWSLDNFGEDLLASPNENELYHWDRSAGPTIRSVVVPEAPATIQRMLISPQARHVIAFGAGTGSQATPGSPDKLLIRWCDSEDFSDWIATTTNLAGDLRLDVGSQIITAIESRGDIIIFTDESLHALQFIGGTLVFGLRHLGQSVSIIGPNAAVDVNGIVIFMGEDDFLIYDGVLRVLDCDVRNQVFDNLNQAQGAKVYCGVNKLFTEVWWLYPSGASNTNDRYVKWNYKDNVWDFGTLVRTAWHDSSRFLAGKPYATEGGKIYQHETGVDDTDENGVLQAMSSRIESGDMEVDPNGQNMMHISAMVPDFKSLTGSIDLTLRGRGYPQRTALQSKGPFTISSTTERQSVRIRTRQISFLIQSDALSDDWRMGTWRAELRAHGRRGGI